MKKRKLKECDHKKINIKSILEELDRLYPNPKTELFFETPFQLLVATMLSAQTTDRQVNNITKDLFAIYSTPADYASLAPEELEKHIKSCGLYKNKAKNIIHASKILVDQYNSRVPETISELVALPGVGRKTASVVLSNAFGKEAFAVDTHVHRVSNRLGLAEAKTVEKTEQDLRNNIPSKDWNKAHHWLIFHGRNVCRARNPECGQCTLSKYCRYYTDNMKNQITTK